MPIEKKKLGYTYEEAAAAVGVSIRTIRALVAKGDLPVKYPTSKPVIPEIDLEAWFESLPSERP